MAIISFNTSLFLSSSTVFTFVIYSGASILYHSFIFVHKICKISGIIFLISFFKSAETLTKKESSLGNIF
ncbi:MAG TPA: hypothetical protein LFW14_04685 [Rickettsia endosymbiont of Degeeriella rufa]|nr:hypothetical protein [Rickettsia endosymbiont of Degeeriella rufa]